MVWGFIIIIVYRFIIVYDISNETGTKAKLPACIWNLSQIENLS